MKIRENIVDGILKKEVNCYSSYSSLSNEDADELSKLENVYKIILTHALQYCLYEEEANSKLDKISIFIKNNVQSLKYVFLNNILGSNKFSSAKIGNIIFNLKGITSLLKIDLSSNNINGVEAITLFESLSCVSKLWELKLSDNNINDVGADAIANFLDKKGNNQLILWLNNCNISVTGALYIFKSLNKNYNTLIEKLYIYDNKLGGSDNVGIALASEIAKLVKKNNPGLILLSFCDCDMEEVQTEIITLAFESNSFIEQIGFTNNKISDYTKNILSSILSRSRALLEVICYDKNDELKKLIHSNTENVTKLTYIIAETIINNYCKIDEHGIYNRVILEDKNSRKLLDKDFYQNYQLFNSDFLYSKLIEVLTYKCFNSSWAISENFVKIEQNRLNEEHDKFVYSLLNEVDKDIANNYTEFKNINIETTYLNRLSNETLTQLFQLIGKNSLLDSDLKNFEKEGSYDNLLLQMPKISNYDITDSSAMGDHMININLFEDT